MYHATMSAVSSAAWTRFCSDPQLGLAADAQTIRIRIRTIAIIVIFLMVIIIIMIIVIIMIIFIILHIHVISDYEHLHRDLIFGPDQEP